MGRDITERLRTEIICNRKVIAYGSRLEWGGGGGSLMGLSSAVKTKLSPNLYSRWFCQHWEKVPLELLVLI